MQYWKFILIGGILGMESSCELGERLEIRDMGAAPGYFIECYCRPGEMFEMTATQIAPVAEPQVLDYSLRFEVYIRAGEWFRLNHSLFQRPGSDFIYNYASSVKLDTQRQDSLWLDVTAPDGSKIRGVTAIPEPVQIDSADIRGTRIRTVFTSSADKEQNFYILSLLYAGEGKMQTREFFLRGYEGRQTVIHEYDTYGKEIQDSVVVVLKRMTAEGYRYQYSLYEAKRASHESLFAPVALNGNLSGALGVFTCYTMARKRVR